jgi:uncharacterized protein (TIGR04255 family)
MPTDKSLADRLPANHPLKLLQVVSEPAIAALLPSFQASCAAAKLQELDIETVLRASLLQALYNINDPDQLIEHLRFNVLFRWFMGKSSLTGQIKNAIDFVQVQAALIDNHTLARFFEHVIKQAADEESPNADYIFGKLSAWMNEYCPREVYFHEYRNSPITDMGCRIIFNPERRGDISEEVFFEYARHDFPIRERKKEKIPFDHSAESAGCGYEPVFYSPCRKYYVTLLTSGAVSLTKLEPYDNWESFDEKFTLVIKHCLSANSLARPQNLICFFNNLIKIPSDLDLCDYFHVAPHEPPPVQVPQIIQELGGPAYEFPRILEHFKVWTKMRYENDGTCLLYCLQTQPGPVETEIMFDLECHWDRPLEMSEVSGAASKLKEHIYVAFHTLIADRTRRLFE